jgi:hypothetical protein
LIDRRCKIATACACSEHAAERPRVIQRDLFVIRVAVVATAPFLRGAPSIRFESAAERAGDILRPPRLAARQTQHGRENRRLHGQAPIEAALPAKHTVPPVQKIA